MRIRLPPAHTTKIVVLTATVLCLPLRAHSQEARGNTLKRDLTIFKRPPWNYNPGSAGTGCVEPNTFFDTDVVVNFQGDSTAELGSSFLLDLEDAFQESYNNLRKEFCDDDSRKVVGVEVDMNSMTIKSPNEFSLRFQVKVGCNLCSMDTNLFEPEYDATRRKTLEGKDADQEEESESTVLRSLISYKRPPYNAIRGASPPTFRPSPSPTRSPVSPPPTPSPIGTGPRMNEDCCPSNGERRAQYASEFTAAFNSAYKALGDGTRALQTDPIQQILEAFELLSITCEDPLEEFESFVVVVLGGNPIDVLASEILALQDSFRSSYNGFGDTLCDPLFRTVTNVVAELEDPDVRYLHQDSGQEGRRQLARGRFSYRVRGKCRGCSGNRRLFSQGSSGRRLEVKYDRQLQFVFDENSCFCAVGAEERGISEDEFTETYDTNIQELNAEGVLQNIESVEGVVEEEIWTWSPTTSPTYFPTAPTDSPVPSPSPSDAPTS